MQGVTTIRKIEGRDSKEVLSNFMSYFLEGKVNVCLKHMDRFKLNLNLFKNVTVNGL